MALCMRLAVRYPPLLCSETCELLTFLWGLERRSCRMVGTQCRTVGPLLPAAGLALGWHWAGTTASGSSFVLEGGSRPFSRSMSAALSFFLLPSPSPIPRLFFSPRPPVVITHRRPLSTLLHPLFHHFLFSFLTIVALLENT